MQAVYVKGDGSDVNFSDSKIIDSYSFDGDTVFIIEPRGDSYNVLQHQNAVKHIDRDFKGEIMWDLKDTSESMSDVATIEDVRTLHNIPSKGKTGKGMTVVVMDSGIDESHAIFSDADIRHVDVTGSGRGDDVGHGTAVAGQIHRLAPDAEIISLRIFGNQGSADMQTIISAYEWLNNNANQFDIVNMSWGTGRPVDTVDRIHKKVLDKRVQDVIAAGNSGGHGGSPATCQGAFSVGACTEGGQMASFSSWDEALGNPELSAIGKDCRLPQARGTVMGRQLTGMWVKASGTSFSSPAVAGMIAKSEIPMSFARLLREGADPLPETEKEGKGLANYGSAAGEDEETPRDTTYAKVWAFAGRDTVYINKDWLESGKYDAILREDGVVELH